MTRRLIVVLIGLVLALAVVPRGSSSAQTAPVDPSAYALATSDFPPGSQVTSSHVASNADVDLRYLQIGPAPPPGRITGYYMQVHENDAAGHLRLVTSYLVSIYGTAEEAATAFANQTAFWQGQVQATANLLPPNTYGDPGQQHWFTLPDSSGNTHSELFFQRGPIFIQVNLDTFGSPAGGADTQLLLSVASKLDARAAGRPLTATPTLTSTPTRTPVPTATSTPRPTAMATRTPTPPPLKPIKETRPCKKGQKRVKGKCKKG